MIFKLTMTRFYENVWGGSFVFSTQANGKSYYKNGKSVYVIRAHKIKQYMKSLFPESKKHISVYKSAGSRRTYFYKIEFQSEAEEAEYIMTFRNYLKNLLL